MIELIFRLLASDTFWIGFAIGFVVSMIVGFIVECMCIAAGRSDVEVWVEKIEDYEDEEE